MLRSLGTGTNQAAAGDDARLSDARTPTVHDSTKHSDSYDAAGAAVAAIATHEVQPDPHPVYMTPAEHTAVGDGSPHHAAVTISSELDAVLALSTQALDLDTQTANKVFAGPTTGSAAKPTMRALVDADIPASIARDSEVTSAVSTHEGASDPHPGYTTTAEATTIADTEADSKVATHAAASDPHIGYQKESEKDAAGGYPSLDVSTKVPIAELPTGTGGSQVALGNHTHAASPQPYDQGAVTVTDGHFLLLAKRHTLSGTDRLTLEGTGRLVIV